MKTLHCKDVNDRDRLFDDRCILIYYPNAYVKLFIYLLFNGSSFFFLSINLLFCMCFLKFVRSIENNKYCIKCYIVSLQFVIFNPSKVSWNWMAFYQNSFVISPGSLYHLIRRDCGRLSNEAFTSNPIVSSKQ